MSKWFRIFSKITWSNFNLFKKFNPISFSICQTFMVLFSSNKDIIILLCDEDKINSRFKTKAQRIPNSNNLICTQSHFDSILRNIHHSSHTLKNSLEQDDLILCIENISSICKPFHSLLFHNFTYFTILSHLEIRYWGLPCLIRQI